MKVSVSGILNGVRKNFDGGEFRILEPPPGLGSVKVNDNYYKPTENIPKRYLANGMITGNKPKDFLYDFVIEVTSFDIKVGNSPSKSVKGNTAVFPFTDFDGELPTLISKDVTSITKSYKKSLGLFPVIIPFAK